MSNCTFTGNQALAGAGVFGGLAEAGGLGTGSNGPDEEVSNTNFIGNCAIGGSSTIANETLGDRGHWGGGTVVFARRDTAKATFRDGTSSRRLGRRGGCGRSRW